MQERKNASYEVRSEFSDESKQTPKDTVWVSCDELERIVRVGELRLLSTNRDQEPFRRAIFDLNNEQFAGIRESKQRKELKIFQELSNCFSVDWAYVQLKQLLQSKEKLEIRRFRT